jgi:hypothetical protein
MISSFRDGYECMHQIQDYTHAEKYNVSGHDYSNHPLRLRPSTGVTRPDESVSAL